MRGLYNEYAPKMLAVSMRYMGNRMEAEDVLQEAFIKVFDNLKTFQGKGSFEGWIRRIVVHTALYHLKRSPRMHRMVDIEGHGSPENQEADALSKLAANDLLKLVSQLPPSYRTVFNLYAIEGFSHREIAELLGVSEGTSKSNLSDARRLLRSAVGQMNGYQPSLVQSKRA